MTTAVFGHLIDRVHINFKNCGYVNIVIVGWIVVQFLTNLFPTLSL